MSKFWQKHWQKVTAGAFWLLIVLAYIFYISSNGLTPRQSFTQALEFMRGNPFAPLLYILLYTLRPLTLFSATVMTIAGGALFGAWWGILYTVIGSNAGASLAYLLGSVLAKDMLHIDENAEKGLQKYLNGMRNNAFETILTMRFLFLPYDLVNYLAGLLRVHYGAFILATILGSIPGTVAFVLAGASTGLAAEEQGFDWRILAISALIFVLSLAIARFFKRQQVNP